VVGFDVNPKQCRALEKLGRASREVVRGSRRALPSHRALAAECAVVLRRRVHARKLRRGALLSTPRRRSHSDHRAARTSLASRRALCRCHLSAPCGLARGRLHWLVIGGDARTIVRNEKFSTHFPQTASTSARREREAHEARRESRARSDAPCSRKDSPSAPASRAARSRASTCSAGRQHTRNGPTGCSPAIQHPVRNSRSISRRASHPCARAKHRASCALTLHRHSRTTEAAGCRELDNSAILRAR